MLRPVVWACVLGGGSDGWHTLVGTGYTLPYFCTPLPYPSSC